MLLRSLHRFPLPPPPPPHTNTHPCHPNSQCAAAAGQHPCRSHTRLVAKPATITAVARMSWRCRTCGDSMQRNRGQHTQRSRWRWWCSSSSRLVVTARLISLCGKLQNRGCRCRESNTGPLVYKTNAITNYATTADVHFGVQQSAHGHECLSGFSECGGLPVRPDFTEFQLQRHANVNQAVLQCFGGLSRLQDRLLAPMSWVNVGRQRSDGCSSLIAPEKRFKPHWLTDVLFLFGCEQRRSPHSLFPPQKQLWRAIHLYAACSHQNG